MPSELSVVLHCSVSLKFPAILDTKISFHYVKRLLYTLLSVSVYESI